jgi:hypothetical protein
MDSDPTLIPANHLLVSWLATIIFSKASFSAVNLVAGKVQTPTQILIPTSFAAGTAYSNPLQSFVEKSLTASNEVLPVDQDLTALKSVIHWALVLHFPSLAVAPVFIPLI